MIYSIDNTKIIDCYKLNEVEMEDRINELYEQRENQGYKITRSKLSYKRELKAHKKLYKWGIMTSHTKDADLEEDISLWKEIIYIIIGF